MRNFLAYRVPDGILEHNGRKIYIQAWSESGAQIKLEKASEKYRLDISNVFLIPLNGAPLTNGSYLKV